MYILLAFVFDVLLALVVMLSGCILCNKMEDRRKKPQLKAQQRPRRPLMLRHPRHQHPD
jgi:hypothetical protein